MKVTDFFIKIEMESVDPNTQVKTILSITPHVVVEMGENYVEAREKVYNDGLHFLKSRIDALKSSKVEQKVLPATNNPPKDLPPAAEAFKEAIVEAGNVKENEFEKLLENMDVKWENQPENKNAPKKTSSFAKYVK